MKAEIIYDRISYCPDHEIWISFDSDDAAVDFYNWWLLEGEKSFQRFVDKNG